jgi:hypothetical protein
MVRPVVQGVDQRLRIDRGDEVEATREVLHNIARVPILGWFPEFAFGRARRTSTPTRPVLLNASNSAGVPGCTRRLATSFLTAGLFVFTPPPILH